eukprot:9612-Heterococcus_DN1.PRE.3
MAIANDSGHISRALAVHNCLRTAWQRHMHAFDIIFLCPALSARALGAMLDFADAVALARLHTTVLTRLSTYACCDQVHATLLYITGCEDCLHELLAFSSPV